MNRGEFIINKIYDLLKGYIEIEIDGEFCEKFINLIIRKNIVIKEINRRGPEKVSIKIYIKDYIKIKNAAKISSCKIKIAKKRGLKFSLLKYKSRIFLISGIALSFLLVYTMSNLVLSIEVKGNSSLSSSYIEELLKKNGVKILSLNNFSTSDVADNIMSVNNNIAWIGIEVRGSKVCVEVVEKPDTPAIYKPDEKYNIVAAEDGVIADIFIKKGVSVVNKGDTVKKNQLLVSGVVDSKIQQYRYVNPEADIRLITWRTKSSVTKLHQTVENLTDNIVKDVLLEFNNKTYGYKRKIPFKYYNDRKKEIKILPSFKILIVEHIENIPRQIEYLPEELFEIERRKLYNDIVSEFNQDYKIINSNAQYNIYNGELNTIVTCTIEGPFVEKIKNE